MSFPRKRHADGFGTFNFATLVFLLLARHSPQAVSARAACVGCHQKYRESRDDVAGVLYLFSAKRYPKTPRQMPAPTSSRLTFETGAYSRVCKQTCPVSRAFSPPSADGSGIKSGFLLSCFSVFCRTARIPDSRIFRISFAADKERLRRRAPGTGVRKAQSFVPVQRGSAVAPAKTACGWFWVPFTTKRYITASVKHSEKRIGIFVT